MPWIQTEITLPAKERGIHLVSGEVLRELPELDEIEVGLLQLFIQHTSASLSINENAAPAVRRDLERHLNEMVPEGQPYYEHTVEGPDDMPAHIKAALLDTSLTIPIRNGSLAFGTWQGIYLNEHRNHGGPRTLVATAYGEAR
jgi:secondary thiamine-phosphate synthase enzyme